MSRPRFAKILVTLWVLAAGSASAQSGAASYGADSPQAVVAAVQKAIAAKDFAASLRYVSPAGREAIVKDLIGGTLVAMAMFDPEVPTVVGKPPSKAEVETQRKNYRTALGILRQALKPHGLDAADLQLQRRNRLPDSGRQCHRQGGQRNPGVRTRAGALVYQAAGYFTLTFAIALPPLTLS